jgi:UDP-N-acetylglucosamine--dolichyl-phosphate N-acetylglucosaminephosphotransferase
MKEVIVAVIAAGLTTFLITPYVIRYFKSVGLVTTDVHKKGGPLVPYSCGVAIAAGIISGLLVSIFISVFLTGTSSTLVTILAATTSILIITFSGLLDDLNSTQVREGSYLTGKRGLKAWQKPLLTLPAAFPLMAIMAGDTQVSLPIVGTVNFGILFPLVIIPIGVVGASNMVNMLGGFNFLQVGMGIIVTAALGTFAIIHGSVVGATILLVTAAALLGAAKFNFPPAKILSGDSDSYLIGAVIAVSAFVGNLERAALTVSIPFIIQAILKFYSHHKLQHFASDTGILQEDGTIRSRYGKSIYSWTHLIMNLGNFSERKIVAIMLAIQSFFAAIIFIGI